MRLKGPITILLFFYVCSVGLSQHDKLSFDAITTNQGLSYNSVMSIGQDREGFMWFGTTAGLNKFNGYAMTVFRSDGQRAGNTLHNDAIWDIHEDRKGRLWVSTLGDGLYQFNKRTQGLTPYRVSTSPDSLYMNIFYSIHEESEAVLWIGNQVGLVRFDINTQKMRVYPLPAPNEVVFCMVEDRSGRLWVGTKMGLYSFDRKTGRYSAVALTNQPQPSQPLVSALYLDSTGLLWVGTNGEALFKLGAQGSGLYQVDTRATVPVAAAYNPDGLIKNNIALNGIVRYAGDVWLATDEGLQRINPTTRQVITYEVDRFSPNPLSSNNILSLFQDRDGNLWIGTDNGVNKVTNTTKKFFSYQIKPAMPSVRLVDNSINTIFQDHTGLTWLGNNVKGLYRFDPLQGLLDHQSAIPTDPHALLSNHVWTVFEDRQQRLWVGTLEGVNRLDPTTGQVTRYPSKIPAQHIVENADGQLWIGGKKGIASFDPATGQYVYQDTAVRGGFNFITDLLASRDGNLWIAQQGALHRFNPRTKDQKFYQPGVPWKVGELTDRDVTAVFEDSRGRIWVGTERGGLNVFNPATNKFTAFTSREGFITSSVSGIIEDKNGDIWVSTQNGISRFNPKTRKFRNYDATDGLPAIEFNKSSVCRRNETLLFGSINGFVVFNPDSVKDNTVIPPVYITGLKVRGKNWLLDSNRLDLQHNENSLSFDFVALNYHSPEKNRYAYKLEGIDDDWVDSGSRRFASYTELSPGTYVFRVKASNDDGVWNTQGASLTIAIARPWWQTWWAYLLYLALFLAAIRAFINYRSRALEKENHLLETKVAERTREVQQQKAEIETQRDNLEQTLTELKTAQNQLIQKEKMASLGELTAGIAHEIQNPLNFVNNFSEISVEIVDELSQEQQKLQRDPDLETELVSDIQANLGKILHHGKRASNIVRGMLDHARTSTGNVQPTNLNALIEEYLRFAFHGQRTKDKEFTCELVTQFDPAIDKVALIPQEIGRVLLNVFNNAFYAVHKKQQQMRPGYQPSLVVSTHQLEAVVEIRVRDNGVGMPQSVQQKIFQPFFTTKPPGEGTGLGLSLSYDIITKVHSGSLQVESQEGEGSEFIVQLPAAATTENIEA
jgi:ligand-binding sensor domain-containing protein/signal transduction histidine kinase